MRSHGVRRAKSVFCIINMYKLLPHQHSRSIFLGTDKLFRTSSIIVYCVRVYSLFISHTRAHEFPSLYNIIYIVKKNIKYKHSAAPFLYYNNASFRINRNKVNILFWIYFIYTYRMYLMPTVHAHYKILGFYFLIHCIVIPVVENFVNCPISRRLKRYLTSEM